MHALVRFDGEGTVDDETRDGVDVVDVEIFLVEACGSWLALVYTGGGKGGGIGGGICGDQDVVVRCRAEGDWNVPVMLMAGLRGPDLWT